MRFEHPSVLWALLFLIIPILIHLFHFKRFKTLYFSSLIFVQQVEQETKSVKKVKHLLILISRLLAFTALVLAFAKPYFPISNQTSNSNITAIFVDNSFSMTNLGSEGSLLETAKEQAKTIVRDLADDEKILVVSNNLSVSEQRFYSKSEALDRIQSIQTSPFNRNFEETSNWIQNQINTTQEGNLARYFYLSDFQESKSTKSDLLLDSTTNLYPIQFKAQKLSNISIDTAWFSNPNFKLNATNELQVIIRNHSPKPVDNLALHLQTNHTQRDVFVNLRANDTAHVSLTYTDSQKGWITGKLSILEEGIIFDDDLYYSYLVQEKNQVLIIDGEDASPGIKTVYELDPFYKVENISSQQVSPELIAQANTILLNGLNQISSGLTEQLINKAKEGAGIGIFLGQNPSINDFNKLLNQLGLGAINRKVNEKFAITNLAHQDLFFKGVFQKKPNQLKLPAQFNYFKLQPSGSTISLLKLENNDPILVRSSKVNVFLFTSNLKKENGEFSSNAIFSTTLLRIAEISGNQQPLYLIFGKSNSYSIQQQNPEKSVRLKNGTIEFIPQKLSLNGKTAINVQYLPSEQVIAGNYNLIEEQEIGKVAINYDRSESELNFMNLNEFENQLKEKGFKKIQTISLEKKSVQTPIKAEQNKEYWKLLLILALLFLLVEMALIKFWK